MNKTLVWLLALVVCAWTPLAAAQAYPSKPIKLIVPYPPGGNTDIVARIFGAKLSERLGQPIVYDNRGGAAGRIGAGVAAKSPADGYTLVIGDLGTLVIASFADPNLQYSPTKDFAPISLVTSVSIVVTANPDFPVNTFPEFLARARANPGKLTYATGGAGGPGHLAFEMLRSMAKIDIVHVPYKGGAPAIVDTIGGRVDVLVDGSAFGQLKGGKLKALAVTGPRLPALPDVPGIGESVPGFNFTNWWGFLAPAGTPPDVVAKLSQAVSDAVKSPEVTGKFNELGIIPVGNSSEQAAAFLRDEVAKWGKVIRTAGVKAD